MIPNAISGDAISAYSISVLSIVLTCETSTGISIMFTVPSLFPSCSTNQTFPF